MPEVNSVVAIYDSRSQAEDAVTELQGAGYDMTRISIVGDTKTGRVFVVCDGPWFHQITGLSRLQVRARRSKRQAPPLDGFTTAFPSMPSVGP